MATITFQFRSSYRLSNGTSLPVPTPSGTTDGDLLLLFVSYQNPSIGAPTVPAGYTQFHTGQTGTGTTDIVRTLYWKEAYQEGTTQQVTMAGTGTVCEAACWRISGADTSNPIDAIATDTTGTGTTVTAPALTTVQANVLACWLGLSNNTTATTFTIPAAWAQHDDPSSSASTWGDGTEIVATPQTLVSDSGTTNGVAGDKWIGMKFSIKPDLNAVFSCMNETAQANPIL